MRAAGKPDFVKLLKVSLAGSHPKFENSIVCQAKGKYEWTEPREIAKRRSIAPGAAAPVNGALLSEIPLHALFATARGWFPSPDARKSAGSVAGAARVIRSVRV